MIEKDLLEVQKDGTDGPLGSDVGGRRRERLRQPIGRCPDAQDAGRTVAELEARLKTQLFKRSSRRATLTDAGRSYIEACKRVIEQVDDAEREVSGEYRVPKGDLAVTAPWGLGHMHLLRIAVSSWRPIPTSRSVSS